jgi:hypothetical protein
MLRIRSAQDDGILKRSFADLSFGAGPNLKRFPLPFCSQVFGNERRSKLVESGLGMLAHDRIALEVIDDQHHKKTNDGDDEQENENQDKCHRKLVTCSRPYCKRIVTNMLQISVSIMTILAENK